MQGQIVVHAHRLGLVPIAASGPAGRVAPPELHRAPLRLQVDAPPAAGAVVDVHPGLAGVDRVPHGVEPLDVANLRQPLAIRRLVLAPTGQRLHVEVGTKPVHAKLADAPDQQLGHPLPGFGIAQVEQSPVGGPAGDNELAGEQKVGMLAGNLAADGHPLRLEPDDEAAGPACDKRR